MIFVQQLVFLLFVFDMVIVLVLEQVEICFDEVLKVEENLVMLELVVILLDNFVDQYFKLVNVVFVIDIFGFMKIGDKMELMKYLFNQFVDVLCLQDYVVMVMYVDDVEMLIEFIFGVDKVVLKNQVLLLKVDGLMVGGKGIKFGFK